MSANYNVEITPSELLRQLWAQKVNLYVVDGKLRYEAPTGAVTIEQMWALRKHRDEIKKLIESTCADCGRTFGAVCCELVDGRRFCSDCMVSK